jgi:predicted nucleic acid-binding protein
MVLVDTPVWIDHLRRRSPRLSALLEDGLVACHPFVIGELACGRLARRDELLGLLERLPTLEPVSHGEALKLVEAHGLPGTGVGWVDVHLLAAARLGGATLWTADRALRAAAVALGCGAQPHVGRVGRH